MKKIIITACFMLGCAFASDKIHVEALDDFSSQDPVENIKAKVIEDSSINDIPIAKDSIIYCKLEKVKDPKRGKMDAKAYFKITNIVSKEDMTEIKLPLEAKYAKSVISKEEIKKIPPKKIAKSTAGAVGSYFIKGFSYGLSFADGVVENPEGNRLKSGAKQVYEDSFLSYAEKGEPVKINIGDTFYLIVKSLKDNEENSDEKENQNDNTPEQEKNAE